MDFLETDEPLPGLRVFLAASPYEETDGNGQNDEADWDDRVEDDDVGGPIVLPWIEKGEVLNKIKLILHLAKHFKKLYY